MSDVQPLASTPPPTILASSILSQRIKPRHASLAAQSDTKRLKKQMARRQLQQQQRRSLPLTKWDFDNRVSK